MPISEYVSTARPDHVGTPQLPGEAVAFGVRRSRPWTRTCVVVAALFIAGGTAACSSDGNAPAVAATVASASSSSSPSPSASPSPTGGGPTPTPGPSVIPKIKRPGEPTRPEVSAAPAPFDSKVTYSDGVELTVDKVVPGVETGEGPGVFAGREFAVFTVTLRNGTKQPIDAQQVVVTSTYGSRGLVAERVYANDTGAADFGGVIAPGKSATARYAFAVPAKEQGDVRLVVDFDGTHTSAQFDGDAWSAS